MAVRKRSQHPDTAQLFQGSGHTNDLGTVLNEVVKELTEVPGRLEKLEKLLERGYPDNNVFSQYRPPIRNEEESH